jgi:hypothetical protein
MNINEYKKLSMNINNKNLHICTFKSPKLTQGVVPGQGDTDYAASQQIRNCVNELTQLLHQFSLKMPTSQPDLSEKRDVNRDFAHIFARKKTKAQRISTEKITLEKLNDEISALFLAKTSMQNDNISMNKCLTLGGDVSCNTLLFVEGDTNTNNTRYIHTDISGNKLSKPVIPIYLENDPFIYLNKTSLTEDICNEIIHRFETDERKEDGCTSGGIDKLIKNTFDLVISRLAEWKDIDEILSKILTLELQNYCNRNLTIMNDNYNINSINLVSNLENVVDFGYQVQRYTKNEGHYIWHHDLMGNMKKNISQQRLLTFIWYLNDVEIGGETEFLHGLVKPETGKLVIFPACFTYFHKGNMPISNDKYIITGWIGYKILGYA